MKSAKLGDVFYWMGKLTKCDWTNKGQRSIGFVTMEAVKCPHCGNTHEIQVSHDVIEDSPLFQNHAEPVNTIKEL